MGQQGHLCRSFWPVQAEQVVRSLLQAPCSVIQGQCGLLAPLPMGHLSGKTQPQWCPGRCSRSLIRDFSPSVLALQTRPGVILHKTDLALTLPADVS